MNSSEIKKKRGVSPIWILPAIALIIGAWLLYKAISEAGVEIVVHFKSAEGITPGKTKVIFKGIPVGLVKDVRVDPGIGSVSVIIEMDKRTKDKLVEDLKFWVVRPEFSAGKISGLDTLLSGVYIAVRPGTSKRPAREFVGLESPPPIAETAPGLHIKLKADALGSIRRGSGIFYRNIQIGSVQEYRLTKDQGVLISAYIEPEYAPLVKKNTRFYDTSGITIKGSLSGIKFHMESLSTLLYGGVGLYTPKGDVTSSEPAQNGDVFVLYKDRDEAEAWDTIRIHMPSAMGLSVGSKLVFRGVEIGAVSQMVFDEKKRITAFVQIQPEASFIMREDTKFWIVRPQVSINRIANLETVIKGTYLTCRPGSGGYADEFTIQQQPEVLEILRPGKRFTLVTEDAESLSLGAPVFYKKIQVGEVVGFDLTPDGTRVKAQIFVEKKYEKLVKRSSIFWKYGGISVKVGWNGLKFRAGTMASILAGGITFINPETSADKDIPASNGTRFTLYDSYSKAVDEVPDLKDRGLVLRLRTEDLEGISVGMPVTYKHIQVGEVAGYELSKDGEELLLEAVIKKKFAYLVGPDSIFWKNSGISVKAGLDGISIKTGPFKAIMAGEIAFMNPTGRKKAGPPKSIYSLFDSYDEAKQEVPVLKPSGLHVTLVAKDSPGLSPGSPVYYKRIKVGEVTGLDLTEDGKGVKISVFIGEKYRHLLRSNSRFYNVSGLTVEAALGGVKVKSTSLKSLVAGGIGFITQGQDSGPPAQEGAIYTLYSDYETALYADEIKHGIDIILKSPTLGSIKKGAPILYKQIMVGSVTGYELAPDASEVLIHANIRAPYNALVFEGTRFWNASGIHVRAGIFSGVRVDTETMETIMTGGIAMATPESPKERGPRARNGSEFTLFPQGKDKWKKWSPKIDLPQ